MLDGRIAFVAATLACLSAHSSRCADVWWFDDMVAGVELGRFQDLIVQFATLNTQYELFQLSFLNESVVVK